MSVQNYADLVAHKGHAISIHTYYDENVAIECEECHEVLLDYEGEGATRCNMCMTEIDSEVTICPICKVDDYLMDYKREGENE